jgi:uncharacterized protein (TIGR02001 family)
MIFTQKVTSLRVLTAAVSMAVAGMAAPLAAQAEVTGNINVVSKYVLRGITTGVGYGTENNGAAVQGGFDYSHESGLYAGYWGSSLSYVAGAQNTNIFTGVENDFYAGYKGKAGSFSYGLGLVYYAYTAVENSDAAEVAATLGFGNASLGINYLTSDVIWGNAGDTYFNLGYTQPLPSDFSLAGSLMYYMYTKDGKYVPETTDSLGSGFRGLSVTLSHPLGKTGGTMGVTVVGGGEDRYGNYQKWMPVLSLGMTF